MAFLPSYIYDHRQVRSKIQISTDQIPHYEMAQDASFFNLSPTDVENVPTVTKMFESESCTFVPSYSCSDYRYKTHHSESNHVSFSAKYNKTNGYPFSNTNVHNSGRVVNTKPSFNMSEQDDVPSKHRPLSISIDNDSMRYLFSYGNVSPLLSPSLPSIVEAVNSESNSTQSSMSFFGDSSCTSLYDQNEDSTSKRFLEPFIPISTISSQMYKHESKISPNKFPHNATISKTSDHASHHGNAAMQRRKQLSQPNLSSTPHMLKSKFASDLKSLRLLYEHHFEPDGVKVKVKSVWNNIKYGWTLKSKSNIRCDSPLFMLGRCYHKRKDDPSTEPEDQFHSDFVSRIWLTYRSNFYPIPGTRLTSDCGWGCMLRTGQMLIAQCLVTHFLGRDWRLYNKQTETDSAFYREIIRWFSDPLDTPSDKTPFCLHHLANFGRVYKKEPGEWYGPSSVAYIFRDAFLKASHTVPVLNQLCLYVAQDCTVYIGDVVNMCTKRPRSESFSCSLEYDHRSSGSKQEVEVDKWTRSLIILIPMRLGGETINEIYIPCVQSLLSHDNCMGIIGGKPKHSLYFMGWQDDKLIYLDPHLCREAVDTTISDFRIETFHCMTPRKLSINKMDPSCCVGFYIRDADDFRKFVHDVKEFIAPPKQRGMYPMFTFSDGHRADTNTMHENHMVPDRKVRVTHYRIDEYGQKHKTFAGESEEFVVL